MDLTTFAIDNGYVEAKLRGYRSSFLTRKNYTDLKNFASLEEVYSYLSTETDYGTYIDLNNISINALKIMMKKKLSDEINYIEMNCQKELANFIFYIRAEYMIDNVMNILEGLRNQAKFDRLLAACDPIGYFPELQSIQINSSDLAVLYETVLIDTPLNDFFLNYLESNTSSLKNFNEVQNFFKEEKPEKVRSSLKKILMEEFYDFTQNLNSTTADSMGEFLEQEADYKTIQIIYNSMEDPKNDRIRIRESLCPSIGKLYPLYFMKLKNVDTFEEMKEEIHRLKEYSVLLNEISEPGKINENFQKTLEDYMYEEEVDKLCDTFDQQGNLAVFYAYVKLKEQEIRNIVWYVEMISRKLPKNDPAWKKIIVPFDDEQQIKQKIKLKKIFFHLLFQIYQSFSFYF